MNNTQCLTASEMAVISTVFLECFENELLKLPISTKAKVESFFINYSVSTKLHTFFTSHGLKNITESIFNDIDFRDFVLCVTDQFKCVTALSDFEGRSIEYSIAYGLDQEETEKNEYLLIPDRIFDNMELNGHLIFSILKVNKWLLTLVLIYMFFQRTSIFQPITQSNTVPNK